MEKIQRIINFHPAYNRIFKEPEPTKDYGIHGVDLDFIVKTEKYGLRFQVFTNWYLPDDMKRFEHSPAGTFQPSSAGVSFHIKIDDEDSQKDYGYKTDECDILNSKCMSDASYSAGDRLFILLCEKGSDEVFIELEKMFQEFIREYEEEDL